MVNHLSTSNAAIRIIMMARSIAQTESIDEYVFRNIELIEIIGYRKKLSIKHENMKVNVVMLIM